MSRSSMFSSGTPWCLQPVRSSVWLLSWDHFLTKVKSRKRKTKVHRINPAPARPLLSSKCRLQGFAPSATISIRREDRLMSLWSLCATNAQCMSLDLTQATFAEVEAEGKELIGGPSDCETLKEGRMIVGEHQGHSGMHLCTGRPSGSRRVGSPSSASTGCWSHASCSWRSETKDTHRWDGRGPPASTRLQAGTQQDRLGAPHTARGAQCSWAADPSVCQDNLGREVSKVV